MLLVTGGAGFIGSNFVLSWLEKNDEPIVNLDKLTYAGNARNLDPVRGDPRHIFVQGDICDRTLVSTLLNAHKPRAIVHFAAESHVDRSIAGPAEFMQTNVMGTFSLLEQFKSYCETRKGQDFRFLHVSTDEVYGSLGPKDPAFKETSAHAPNSPYAASKAAADHMVRAYHRTYGLPAVTTNCSNNYGPNQFPEKLIPLMIHHATAGKPLPIYGDGKNVRDWLFVLDHCEALRLVLEKGRIGETYNIGGGTELSNIELVERLCSLLDEMRPEKKKHSSLISFVKDRPGHDRRYAIDSSKIRRELGWQPKESFESGLKKTVAWYLDAQRRAA